jgi:hypothetical protein
MVEDQAHHEKSQPLKLAETVGRFVRSKMSKDSKEREAASGADPVPTQSKILPNSDDSRKLFCLIEGDSSVFTVTVPGNCLILELKDFIHQRIINGTNHAIDAKDLALFKVRSVPHS